MLSGHREMVTWSLDGRRISVLRNSFLCRSPLFWLMCDSTTSFLSVCCCPCLFSSQGKCRMVALGGSSLLCPTHDLTWPSIIGPLSPPLVAWWCLPMSLFLLYCMLAQHTYKPFFYHSYKWKVKSKSPHGYDLRLSGAFLLHLPQSLRELGRRIKDLPWWLISLPSLSCFSHWVKGYILFLSRWWESPIFFLAYCIDFVKLWLSCPDLTLDIGRVLNILFRVLSPQKPNQQPTNQT